MEVVLVRWPAEADRRCLLQSRRIPRLLLVEEGWPPPSPSDCLEDWMRVPADDSDLRARMASLSARAGEHGADVVLLDVEGVLRFADRWVALSPLEVRLTRALLDHFGAVTRRDELTSAAWAEEPPPTRNALDVQVLRLRRRLVAVGLTVKTLRNRGYVLEATDAVQEHAREA